MSSTEEIVHDRFPDIEIYIQRVEVPALIEWLEGLTEVSDVQEKGQRTVLTLTNQRRDSQDDGKPVTDESPGISSMTCTIVPDAVKGKFTSVWVTPNETKWLTDQDFAREAFSHFQLEIRCSTGSWDGNDEQGWIRITRDGESIVNWLVD